LLLLVNGKKYENYLTNDNFDAIIKVW
jgi:hypothetical protein